MFKQIVGKINDDRIVVVAVDAWDIEIDMADEECEVLISTRTVETQMHQKVKRLIE